MVCFVKVKFRWQFWNDASRSNSSLSQENLSLFFTWNTWKLLYLNSALKSPQIDVTRSTCIILIMSPHIFPFHLFVHSSKGVHSSGVHQSFQFHTHCTLKHLQMTWHNILKAKTFHQMYHLIYLQSGWWRFREPIFLTLENLLIQFRHKKQRLFLFSMYLQLKMRYLYSELSICSNTNVV